MKTKIVVLHLKEVLFTALFAILGILLISMIIILFLPNKSASTESGKIHKKTEASKLYTDGEYTAPVTLGNDTFHIQIKIKEGKITEISYLDLSKDVKTMYPLLIPTLEDLSKQIITNQSLDEVVYQDDKKYTSLVLLNAIGEALNNAIPNS